MTKPKKQDEDWRKTNYPCNVCDALAIACLRPDMDIKGLCFCETHRDEVYAVYMMVGKDEDMVKKLMKGWRHK